MQDHLPVYIHLVDRYPTPNDVDYQRLLPFWDDIPFDGPDDIAREVDHSSSFGEVDIEYYQQYSGGDVIEINDYRPPSVSWRWSAKHEQWMIKQITYTNQYDHSINLVYSDRCQGPNIRVLSEDLNVGITRYRSPSYPCLEFECTAHHFGLGPKPSLTLSVQYDDDFNRICHIDVLGKHITSDLIRMCLDERYVSFPMCVRRRLIRKGV